MSSSLSNYSKSLEKSERGEILLSNVLKVISFGKQGTKETLETRIWKPATFGPWNPESTDVESRIHGHGIRNPQRGIQNPRLSWITLHGPSACVKRVDCNTTPHDARAAPIVLSCYSNCELISVLPTVSLACTTVHIRCNFKPMNFKSLRGFHLTQI